MTETGRRLARTVLLTAALGATDTALAQRGPLQETDGRGRSCSQVAQMCTGGQQRCEGLRQECIRTGTFQTLRGSIQNLERR